MFLALWGKEWTAGFPMRKTLRNLHYYHFAYKIHRPGLVSFDSLTTQILLCKVYPLNFFFLVLFGSALARDWCKLYCLSYLFIWWFMENLGLSEGPGWACSTSGALPWEACSPHYSARLAWAPQYQIQATRGSRFILRGSCSEFDDNLISSIQNITVWAPFPLKKEQLRIWIFAF